MPVILPRLMATATLLWAGAAWAQEPVVRGAPQAMADELSAGRFAGHGA